MVDQISAERRSAVMAKIKGKDTGPEIRVRKVAHALGFRFRLHRRDLPGNPDLVFPKYKIALFVHGCFWHQHSGCRRASVPKSKIEYWSSKLKRNVERDARVAPLLKGLEWNVVTVWECETNDPKNLAQIIIDRIRSPDTTYGGA